MSSDKHCCVPGCKKSGGAQPVLHHFPNPEKERERFNTWLYAIGGAVLGLDNELIYKHRRVCRAHFAYKYLCRNNRLSNTAVPTLNMPGPFSSSKFTSCERQPLGQNRTEPLITPSENLHTKTEHLEKENIDPVVQIHPSVSNPETVPHIPLLIPPTVKEDTQQNPNPETVHVPSSHSPAKEGALRNLDAKTRPKLTSKKNIKRLEMNSVEKDLYNKICAMKIKLSKYKSKVKRQSAEIKAAKKFATNPSVLETLDNCSSTAKLLMQMQWRENRKKEQGRRFTVQEKILALSILKQTPKGYRFFRKIFILPAPQTLIKLVQKSNLKPGINKNIFTQLRKKAESMKEEEKLCIILFDEISLNGNVTYQERKDKVAGFVDNGQQRQPEFADHAQVFMVRGLMKNYKQAVSYTFSSKATKGPELAAQIKKVVTEVQQAGLIVVASVCDQGPNNRHAIRLLMNETRGVYLRRGEEPKEKIILINNQEIIPIYDPPHLLKGMRNNLLTKNLIYTKDNETKTAKWSHIEQLHSENPGYKGIRLIPKLSDCHVKAEKMNKMKVKYASQIFSRTVASNMGYLADKNILPAECRETADLLLLMDNLFDSVNGSFIKKSHAKPLLGAVTPNSVHHKTWSESKAIIKSMKFVNFEGKVESVPTLSNWVWTLDAIEVLLNKLAKDFGVTSVWMRHLNQDPIENFFGSVRSHGCRNINPTCDQFESAFATLLINNLNSVHTSSGKNCEGDFCEALHALVITENSEASSTDEVDFEKILNIRLTPVSEKAQDPKVIAPLQYVSGYFVKKSKSKIFKGCANCKNDLMGTDEIEYIKYREFEGRRWLCTPSSNLINLISNMQDIIDEVIKDNFAKENIKEIMKTAIFLLVDFNFLKCNVHKQKLIDYLTNLMIRFSIFNYCKNINQILYGRKQVHDDDDVFQIKAKKYYSTCSKRKK